MVYDNQKSTSIKASYHINDIKLSLVTGESAQQPDQAIGCQSDMIGDALLSNNRRKRKDKKTT
jgi:hypothetical protein